MKYLKELKKLNLPRKKFAIFGGGPLVIRSLRKSNDIDIIVKDDLWKELKKKYPLKEGRDDCIQIGNIEIFKDWPPFRNGDKLIDNSDIFNGVRFVKLKYVLKWKKTRNKEKDKKDIKLVEDYLKKGKR